MHVDFDVLLIGWIFYNHFKMKIIKIMGEYMETYGCESVKVKIKIIEKKKNMACKVSS